MIHDFDVAQFIRWNEQKGRPCQFWSHICNVNRSPDECQNLPLTSKIDVYGLKNVLFFILSDGLTPFKGLMLKEKARNDVLQRGAHPRLPKEY